MMKKQLLHVELEIDFSLVGISCHLKDYRFVWSLNKALHTKFSKTKEFCLHEKECSFSQYDYKMELSTAYVFSNRSPQGYLVSTKPQVDFWIKLNDPYQKDNLELWLKKIREISQVLVAYEEHDEKIKEQFLFE